MHAALLATTLLAISGSAVAQAGFCPEAARFGFSTVTPSTGLTGGQTITITSNFTCSHEKGIVPSEVNYIIENTINNNGHEPEILVARRTNPGVFDSFQTTVPYYPAYFPNASYSLVTQLTYPVSDSTSGQTSYIVGGQTSNAISIVPNVS